jgi:hypothetical protein
VRERARGYWKGRRESARSVEVRRTSALGGTPPAGAILRLFPVLVIALPLGDLAMETTLDSTKLLALLQVKNVRLFSKTRGKTGRAS